MSFHIPTRTDATRWNLVFQYSYAFLAFISGFVLIPLYLKYVPTPVYGGWLATGNILIWLTLIDPGLSTILQQRVALAYGKKDLRSATSTIASGLLLTFIVGVLIIASGFVASHFLSFIIGSLSTSDQELLQEAFILAAIGTSLSVVSYSFASINLALLGSFWVGIIQVVVTSLSIVVTVFLLTHGYGLFSIAYGGIFRGIGYTLGHIIYFVWRLSKEEMGFSSSLEELPALAKLISYTFFSRAAGVISANLDSVMVARVLGTAIAPILDVTRKVPDTSRMLTERPAIAMIPGLAHVMGSGQVAKAKELLLRFFRALIWFLFLIVGGLVAFNHSFVKLWVGEKFFAGANISILLCVVLLISVFSNSLSNICFSLGDIKGTSRAGVFQSIANIFFAYAGIKLWGLLGLVLAPLAGVFLVSGWYYPRVLRRLIGMNRRDALDIASEAAKVGSISIVAIALFSTQSPSTWFSFGLVVAAYSIVYICSLLAISSMARKEGFEFFKWAFPSS
jgi:O-antigen/teichoic acid export membrane protein